MFTGARNSIVANYNTFNSIEIEIGTFSNDKLKKVITEMDCDRPCIAAATLRNKLDKVSSEAVTCFSL